MIRSAFSWVCPPRRKRALFATERRAIVWSDSAVEEHDLRALVGVAGAGGVGRHVLLGEHQLL